MLRGLQSDALAILEDGLAGAQQARADLSEAIAERTDLSRRFEEDEVQIAILLASADTLADFAEGLSQTRSGGTGPDARTLRGTIPLPVAGQVIRDFNAADAAGIARPGILIAVRPQALVTAPVAATV